MSDKNNPAPVVTSNQGGVRTEESPASVPQGGVLSRDAIWKIENLRVGNNLSIVASRPECVEIQVAVCARWDVAQHICRLHNELRSQVDLFLDEPMSVGQAKVLDETLHLLESNPNLSSTFRQALRAPR